MEIRMSPRLALGIGVAVLAFAVGAPHLATSQTLAQTSAQPPAQTQPAPAGKSDAKPDTKPDTPPAAQPPAQAPAASVQPPDPFGEDATLTAKPIVFLKGTGTWDSAFETITTSFK